MGGNSRRDAIEKPRPYSDGRAFLLIAQSIQQSAFSYFGILKTLIITSRVKRLDRQIFVSFKDLDLYGWQLKAER